MALSEIIHHRLTEPVLAFHTLASPGVVVELDDWLECSMFLEPFDRMVVVFSTGTGLAVLAGANAFLRNLSLAARAVVSCTVVGLTAAGAAAGTGLANAGLVSGGILAGIGAVLLLAGSPWTGRMVAALFHAARLPALRWFVAGAAGLVVALGTVIRSEAEYFESVDHQMAELEAVTSPPPSKVPASRAWTDAGREVGLRQVIDPRSEAELQIIESAIMNNASVRDALIRHQSGSDATNCHGWVFTGGRFWVVGHEVDGILADNGYQIVRDPRPGDLAIYRNSSGISHTALVRYVTEGLPVLVESKWGCTGVYTHPVDKSVYGQSFQYYRSARSGHVLAGLTSPEEAGTSTHLLAEPVNPDEFTE